MGARIDMHAGRTEEAGDERQKRPTVHETVWSASGRWGCCPNAEWKWGGP